MMFGYGSSGWTAWEVALMWAGMIAVVGLLIWAGYALITNATRRPGREHRGQDPRRVLDDRLAHGEIGTVEYQRLRDLIAAGDHQTPSGTGSGR